MAKTIGQKLGITANQQKKFENASELLNTIVKYASAEPVNVASFKGEVMELISKEEASQGLFSSKGELRQILDDVLEKIEELSELDISARSAPTG